MADSSLQQISFEVIHGLVDPNDCRLDHHGYCQEHGHMSETICPHKRAKWLLEVHRPDLWKDILEHRTTGQS